MLRGLTASRTAARRLSANNEGTDSETPPSVPSCLSSEGPESPTGDYIAILPCCCRIFVRYFWKKCFWMSFMSISRPWM